MMKRRKTGTRHQLSNTTVPSIQHEIEKMCSGLEAMSQIPEDPSLIAIPALRTLELLKRFRMHSRSVLVLQALEIRTKYTPKIDESLSTETTNKGIIPLSHGQPCTVTKDKCFIQGLIPKCLDGDTVFIWGFFWMMGVMYRHPCTSNYDTNACDLSAT
jgi:hypothetical protein